MNQSAKTLPFQGRTLRAEPAAPKLEIVASHGRPVSPAPRVRYHGKLLGGRYRVLERLGRGGMASVYRGEHVGIGKPVAIKVLDPALCGEVSQRRRFFREARASSRLAHPHVIDVTDCGHAPDGSVFMVMELLGGEDLSHTVRREGPFSARRLQHVGLQICDAVGAAHKAGVLHRDLKPENCFRITRGGSHDFIKVLDFGLAKLAQGSQLTVAGTIMGTPAYMSPEQAQGNAVDERTDIYAIGVMLYEFATGRPPFDAQDPLAILQQQVWAEPTPPSQAAPTAGISPQLEALILKALQKDPAERFSSVEELSRALAAIPLPKPRRPRRPASKLRAKLLAFAAFHLAAVATLAGCALASGHAVRSGVRLDDVVQAIRTLLGG